MAFVLFTYERAMHGLCRWVRRSSLQYGARSEGKSLERPCKYPTLILSGAECGPLSGTSLTALLCSETYHVALLACAVLK